MTIEASDRTDSGILEVDVIVTNEWLDSDEVPVISGTAQVGHTLVADVSGIWDSDKAVIHYFWIRSDGAPDTFIDESASASNALNAKEYTLTTVDQGHVIKVKVHVLWEYSRPVFLMSQPTATVTATTGESMNNSASGVPIITGTVRVGETLTADVSGISDSDGLTSATFSYQWLTGGADISGATDATYILVDADIGRTISVTVSFTDDAGNEESLTSAATAVVASAPASPLTASLENTPSSHYGENAFAFDLRFSEELSVSYRTLRDHAFTVSGGTVRKAGRLEQGSNSGWRITVQPNVNGEVTVILPVTTDCTDQGAICTEDGRKLSSRLELTVSGPESQQQPVQNSPSTGTPTITGTARVGETLTADASGIVDEDGLDNVSFSYQWISNDGNADTDILEGTASTYTLADADEGRTIKVTVSFTDDAGNDETLTSTATGEVEARPNSPATGQPTINGTALVGEILMADTSGIADEDGLTNVSFRYQWISNDSGADSEIGGATGSTYTLDSRDVGKTIEVRVSFTDDRGHGEELTSAAAATVEALEPDLAYVALFAFAGAWGIYPGDTITLSSARVRNDGNGVSPATTLRYYQSTDEMIEASDTEVGTEAVAELAASASFNGGVVEVTAPSSPGTYYYGVCVDAVAGESDTTNNCSSSGIRIEVLARNTAPTGLPSISGTAQVGETLTADVSGISDADGLSNASFSYQWLADGADISDATASTYTLADAEEGKAISVRVSFTDNVGHEETLTSAATSVVEAAPLTPLTAVIQNAAASHDGESVFTFELRFSEEFGLSYKTLRDHAFTVTGGTVKKAQRLEQGSNIGWKITVRPNSDGDVTIVLPTTEDCDAQGAICTDDGRKLSSRLELTVSGP